MRKGTVVGMVIVVGLLIVLKVFQDSIPRITDPLSNIIVLTIFILSAIIYSIYRSRKVS